MFAGEIAAIFGVLVDESYTFYFAGELFSVKHLLGNALLADAIAQRSRGRYRALLPQDLEQRDTTPHAIRDQDFRALLHCDLGLFNYDGTDLDSGTVAEFMFAKFADIPAVLLRTDFRYGGDQEHRGEPWNLMTSYFPRTATVVLDAMSLYKEESVRAPGVAAGYEVIARTADAVIAAFDEVLALPPALSGQMRETVYQWIARMPNFTVAAPEQMAAELRAVCDSKRRRGL